MFVTRGSLLEVRNVDDTLLWEGVLPARGRIPGRYIIFIAVVDAVVIFRFILFSVFFLALNSEFSSFIATRHYLLFPFVVDSNILLLFYFFIRHLLCVFNEQILFKGLIFFVIFKRLFPSFVLFILLICRTRKF